MDPAPHPSISILAVAVLYRRRVSQSQSVSSLFQITSENPDLQRYLSLVIYDNSPEPQPPPESGRIPIHYVHDPANSGLATAYNFALAEAEQKSCEWLLLLDQDTLLTREFLLELVDAATALSANAAVAAIVPKLVVNGVVHSPARPFLEQIRRQFQPAVPPIPRGSTGVLPQQLSAYNSGSTLRVAALRAVDGFPQNFWLDFLDHAVFEALLHRGYQVHVMVSALTHDASYTDMAKLPLWRWRNVLGAQARFVRQNGSLQDRLLYRLWLFRLSRKLYRTCDDPQMWREAVRHAMHLRTADSGPPR